MLMVDQILPIGGPRIFLFFCLLSIHPDNLTFYQFGYRLQAVEVLLKDIAEVPKTKGRIDEVDARPNKI